MKKAVAIVLTVLFITVIAVLLSAAGRTRRLDADYALDFEGTTAICTAVVTGERKDDFIQVTMRLKREDVIWKTWNQEGYFQVALEGTCEDLIKNKVYTLEISAKINGNPQPVLVVSKVCSGIVPTQPTIPTTQPTTAPTTVPTTPTTQPTVPPTPAEEGSAIIFRGPPFTVGYPEWYPREGEIGHLYWAVKSTGESILVCDEPVAYVTKKDTHIFFVKKSEPSKVYATPYGDFTKHELVYESTYGDISYIGIESDLQGFLQFVAEEKKFVVLNLATGESTLLMEQDYITYAWLFGTGDGSTWSEIIEFEGLPTGENSGGIFTYNYVTGKLAYGDN